MIADFLKAFYYYLEGFNLLSKKGFRIYFLYSGLIGLAVMALCYFIIRSCYNAVGNFIADLIPWEFEWLDIASDWLSFGGMLIVFFLLFKYFMLIFTAPLMSHLSAKIEEYLEEGRNFDNTYSISLVKELFRGLLISLRNVIRELCYTLLLLILTVIPGMAILSSPLILAVQSYYAGFGNFDFWAERHFPYSRTIQFMSRNKGMLIGNGLIYVLLISVPLIGVFLAPPLSTAAATLQGHKQLMVED